MSGRDRQGGAPAPQRGGGGRDTGYGRQDRPDRVERAPRPSGGDPWSEVPPELEEMLRAQLAQTSKGRPAAPGARTSTAAAPIADASAAVEPAGAPKRRTTRKASTAMAEGSTAPPEASTADLAEAPKRRTTRKASTATAEAASGTPEVAAPKRRTTRKAATATSDADPASAAAEPEASAAPKRRTTRKKAEPA